MKILIVVCAMLALAGCTIVPFEYTSTSGAKVEGTWFTVGQKRALNINVTADGDASLDYEVGTDPETVQIIKATISAFEAGLAARMLVP